MLVVLNVNQYVHWSSQHTSSNQNSMDALLSERDASTRGSRDPGRMSKTPDSLGGDSFGQVKRHDEISETTKLESHLHERIKHMEATRLK